MFSFPYLVVVSPALIKHNAGVNSEPDTVINKVETVLKKEGKKGSCNVFIFNIYTHSD